MDYSTGWLAGLIRVGRRVATFFGTPARAVEDLEFAWSVMRDESEESAADAVPVDRLRVARSVERGGMPAKRVVARAMADSGEALERVGAQIVEATCNGLRDS